MGFLKAIQTQILERNISQISDKVNFCGGMKIDIFNVDSPILHQYDHAKKAAFLNK